MNFSCFVSLPLVAGYSAFLHDGYLVAIENYCAPMVVQCTLFAMCIASLLLGTLFNTIFAKKVKSLLLGASFKKL